MPEPGGPLAPPIFGISVNPIPSGEGRLSPPITTGTPKVCDLPASLKNSSGLRETRDIRNTRRSGSGQVGLDLLDLQVPRGRSPKSPEVIGQVGY